MQHLIANATPPSRELVGSSTSTAMGALRREWNVLSQTPLPWGVDGSAATTAGQLLEAVVTGGDHDRLLLQLLRLHHDGQELAGRIVLQAMLGRTQRLTRTAAARGHDGDEAVAAMWSAIALYPLHRAERVAANLAMDALGYLSPADADVTVGGDALEDLAHDAQDAGRAYEVTSASDEAVTVLLWALDHDVLTREEVQLLAATSLGEAYRDHDALPADMTPAAARQRRSRATRKLAAAVAARV